MVALTAVHSKMLRTEPCPHIQCTSGCCCRRCSSPGTAHSPRGRSIVGSPMTVGGGPRRQRRAARRGAYPQAKPRSRFHPTTACLALHGLHSALHPRAAITHPLARAALNRHVASPALAAGAVGAGLRRIAAIGRQLALQLLGGCVKNPGVLHAVGAREGMRRGDRE